MGGVEPVVLRGQPHLPITIQTVGNWAKLQDRVPIIMRVIDLTPCREANWGTTSQQYQSTERNVIYIVIDKFILVWLIKPVISFKAFGRCNLLLAINCTCTSL